MKNWLYCYLIKYKYKYRSVKHIYSNSKNYLFFVNMLLGFLYYKCCYLLAYNLYYKPYKNKLLITKYTDEFHPDLNGYLLEYSWLGKDEYSKYKLILVKARNKAHNY